MTIREAIENEIERLVAILDVIDGDPDLEPEIDIAADDVGEPAGMTFMELAA